MNEQLDYQRIGVLLDALKRDGVTIPDRFFPCSDPNRMDALAEARSARADLSREISAIYETKGLLPAWSKDAVAARHFKALMKALQIAVSLDGALMAAPFAGQSDAKGYATKIVGLLQAETERLASVGADTSAPLSAVGGELPSAHDWFVDNLARVYDNAFGFPRFRYGRDSAVSGGGLVTFIREIEHMVDGRPSTTAEAARKACQRARATRDRNESRAS